MDVTAPALFRQPPGLEKEQRLVLTPPPGLESCVPQPQCPHAPPVTTDGAAQAAVWKACEIYLRHHSQMFQDHFARAAAITNLHANATMPLKPPGTFLPSNISSCSPRTKMMKPLGALQRVDSNHSLASTAATTTGRSEDDKQDEPSRQVQHIEHNRELRVEHAEDGRITVYWPVDAKKLRGKDQHIVSPSFEIYPGSSFKLMLRPKPVGEGFQTQASFKKARGRGSVELKLTSDMETAPELRFCISVGRGSPRGPAKHDFNNSSVGGLAQNDEVFDFASAACAKASLVFVSLEILEVLPSVHHL